jgi:uncharacterized protein (TIGR00251 family)
MEGLDIQQIDDVVLLKAKVVPGSSKTSVAGVLDGMLKVKISAAPEKGKANQSLVKYLAKQLNVKNKNVTIVSGLTNPIKQIRIENISPEKLEDAFGINVKGGGK